MACTEKSAGESYRKKLMKRLDNEDLTGLDPVVYVIETAQSSVGNINFRDLTNTKIVARTDLEIIIAILDALEESNPVYSAYVMYCKRTIAGCKCINERCEHLDDLCGSILAGYDYTGWRIVAVPDETIPSPRDTNIKRAKS